MGYSITWHKYGASCLYRGELRFTEIATALLAIHKHAEYDRFKFTLHDFTAVTAVTATQTGPYDLSMMIAHTLGANYSNPAIKTAFVAVLPQLVTLGAQFAERTQQNVKTFSTLESARRWLQVAQAVQ